METQVRHPDPVALQMFAERTYSTPELAALSGLTPRQLNWMDQQGALKPSVPARGSGTRRRYSEADAAKARLAGALRRMGASSETIATALDQLPRDPASWPSYCFIDADGTLREYGPAHAIWYGVSIARLLAEPAQTVAPLSAVV